MNNQITFFSALITGKAIAQTTGVPVGYSFDLRHKLEEFWNVGRFF
jgi:hypothetical protein